MSSLNYDNITIYDAMQNIKNDRYVMPAFQRQYVWSMEQIEKLWDSILLDYCSLPRKTRKTDKQNTKISFS